MTINSIPVFVKRLRSACLAMIPLLFLCSEAAADVNSGRIIRVGVYENEPKIFTSQDHKPSGIFIDIIEFIAKNEGWGLQYVSGTWAQGLQRLENGEIDLMPDMAYTPERGRKFSFHKVPVLLSWSQIYCGRGSKIKSIMDLDKKRVAVLEGSIQQKSFTSLAGGFGLDVTLVAVRDYGTMFDILGRGETDAGITNRFYGLVHAKRTGIEDTGIIFDPVDIFFAAPVNDPLQLMNTIDSYLIKIKKDTQSVYFESLKRWTSEDVTFKIPVWLKILGIVMGAVILTSITGSVILKHEVNRQTLELKQINQGMEQRIAQRTAELAIAKDRAEASDRIKSAFLATMSHELRTPLNSIIGFTGVILQGLPGPLNDEQKKQLGMVRGSAQHLLSLINDVLDISKIEAGQFEMRAEKFSLRDIIEKAVAAIKPAAEKKGIKLDMKLEDETGEAFSDSQRVEQVLLNLLSNAIKFTDRGSVSVTAENIPEYIHGSAGMVSKPLNAVRIDVTDTGIGISEEHMKDIFQPFHQVDTGLSRKNEGTGLGLAISRKLAELMGGEITAESKPGCGSVFTFTIPLNIKELS